MKISYQRSGFTLPEFLIATALLGVILSGIMVTYFRCLELNEISANTSTAVLAARNRMAEIENTPFSQIINNFHNVPFPVNGLNGMGVSYAENFAPGVLTITTVVSWREKNGRLFGEDANLNGQMDPGEDLNGNGRIDSLVQFETRKFNL